MALWLVMGPSPGSLSLSLFLSLCLSAHSGRCCCVAAMRAQQQTPSTAAATVAASFVLVSSARLLLLLLLDWSVLAHAFFPPQLLWDIHLHDTCGGGVWELVRFGRERERERVTAGTFLASWSFFLQLLLFRRPPYCFFFFFAL